MSGDLKDVEGRETALKITEESSTRKNATLEKELENIREQLKKEQQEATKERDAAVALANDRLAEAQKQAKATEGTLSHLQRIQQTLFESSEAATKRSGELEVAHAGLQLRFEGLQEEHNRLENVQRETKAQVDEWIEVATEREERIEAQEKAIDEWEEAYGKMKAAFDNLAPHSDEYAEEYAEDYS